MRLDSRWKLQPQTTGVIGYTYSQTDYRGTTHCGNTAIAPGTPGGYVMSDFRNSVGHRFYRLGRIKSSAAAHYRARFGRALNIRTMRTIRWGHRSESVSFEGSLTYMFQTTTALSAGVRYIIALRRMTRGRRQHLCA